MWDNRVEIFLKIAERKSISEASRELHISQPALTSAVQKMEEVMGLKLFYRYRQGLELTAAGDVVYRYYKEIKKLGDTLETEISKLKETLEDHLLIGASTTVGEYYLPYLMGYFYRNNPGIRYTFTVGNKQQIMDALHEGKIEMAFIVGNPPSRRVICQRILEDEMVLIATPRHEWSQRGEIEKHEISGCPFIMREKDSGSRMDMERAFCEAGISMDELNIVAEFNTLEAIKAAVEAGMGAAMISRWAIHKELALKTLALVKIKGGKISRDVYAVYLKEGVLTCGAERLLELAQRFSRLTPLEVYKETRGG